MIVDLLIIVIALIIMLAVFTILLMKRVSNLAVKVRKLSERKYVDSSKQVSELKNEVYQLRKEVTGKGAVFHLDRIPIRRLLYALMKYVKVDYVGEQHQIIEAKMVKKTPRTKK